jgi:hypothetical protein
MVPEITLIHWQNLITGTLVNGAFWLKGFPPRNDPVEWIWAEACSARINQSIAAEGVIAPKVGKEGIQSLSRG